MSAYQAVQAIRWYQISGVTDDFEPQCGCCELNLSSLEEQPGLLTIEPSLILPQILFFVLVTRVYLKRFPHY